MLDNENWANELRETGETTVEGFDINYCDEDEVYYLHKDGQTLECEDLKAVERTLLDYRIISNITNRMYD